MGALTDVFANLAAGFQFDLLVDQVGCRGAAILRHQDAGADAAGDDGHATAQGQEGEGGGCRQGQSQKVADKAVFHDSGS
jgi:hypothetical protein